MLNVMDEIVSINIAGELFQTFEATFNRFPNSLLGSPAARQSLRNPKTGEIYMDRNADLFESILYFYQSQGDLILPYFVPLDILIEELRFFQIDPRIIRKVQVANGALVEEEEEKAKVGNNIFEPPFLSTESRILEAVWSCATLFSILVFVLQTVPGKVRVRVFFFVTINQE